MMKGRVKRIVRDRGFGFITTQASGEYFFHRSGMANGPRSFDTLNENDSVSFEPETGEKGPRALDVRVV